MQLCKQKLDVLVRVYLTVALGNVLARGDGCSTTADTLKTHLHAYK